MRTPSIVGIAGSVRQPSRTTSLVAAVLDGIGARIGGQGRLIELADRGASFFDALSRDAMNERARAIVEAIEDADILVVGTPVYRASYTGLFKHVFDLVHHEALIGTTVVLTATGGSPLHGLVMEHQLRPLFAFFRAHTVPSAVYATEADFDRYELTSTSVRERVQRAADEAVRLAVGGYAVGATAQPAAVPALA
jgi:FMN reductase